MKTIEIKKDYIGISLKIVRGCIVESPNNDKSIEKSRLVELSSLTELSSEIVDVFSINEECSVERLSSFFEWVYNEDHIPFVLLATFKDVSLFEK